MHIYDYLFFRTVTVFLTVVRQKRACRASLFLAILLGSSVVNAKLCRDFFSNNTSTEWAFGTIGIEIEGEIPSHKTYKDMRNLIISKINKNRGVDIVRAVEEGLNEPLKEEKVFFKSRSNEYEYTILDDKSLKPSMEGYQPVEVTSPIIRSLFDLKEFTNVISSLKNKLSFSSIKGQSGLHVHVGFSRSKVKELAILLLLFDRYQISVQNYFKSSKTRSRYFELLDPEVLDYVKDPYKSSLSIDRMLKISRWSRDRALNIVALDVHGTVEFRLFNSTVETPEILKAVRFSKGIVDFVLRSPDRAFELSQLEETRLGFEILMREVGLEE